MNMITNYVTYHLRIRLILYKVHLFKSSLSRTGQGIELMFLGIGLGDQDVFINKAIAR